MYDKFAAVYDGLTENVDYKKRTEYLCSLFNKYDRMPTLMLDLACGTGGFSNEFAAKGVSVIGVDVSEDMLGVAMEKSRQAGQDVMYLCQDARNLDLYGTVDGAVCCLDSLNHIIDYDDFCATIGKVSLFLEPDRLFIFDVNTVYKHREILGNNTFVLEDEKVYCVWQNEYCEDDRTANISLDFFEKDGDVWHRSGEDITEKAYTRAEITDALSKAGLKLEAVYAEMTYFEPAPTTEREVYIARKM